MIRLLAMVFAMTMIGGAAQAVPTPIEAAISAGTDTEVSYITTGAIEDVYDTHGKFLRRVHSPTQVSGYSPELFVVPAVVRHASTGCHKIRAFQTGFSLNGTVLWKYWVSTYSCWNVYKRLVTNVVNRALFTNVTQTFHVNRNLWRSSRHFYNPTNSWDPFPVVNLNSHSAYVNYSRGEIEGTCSYPPFPTCWWHPWGTIRSLYNGNWSAKSGHPMNKSG